MITEGTIVGVLHDRHQLNRIVTRLDNTREYHFAKLIVGPYALFFLCHANMGFVNERCPLGNNKRWKLPNIGYGRIPDLSRKKMGLWILNHASRIRRNTLATPTLPCHLEPIVLAVANRFERKAYLPLACIPNSVEQEPIILDPSREIAHQPNSRRMRRPFTENPTIRSLMQAIIFMCAGKLG